MYKYALGIICLLFVLSITAKAQEEPKFELFTGYSYMNEFDFVNNTNLNGFNVAATANIYKGFGLTFDYSHHRGSREDHVSSIFGSIGNVERNTKYNTFLFGPSYKARLGRVEPFLRVLLGVAKVDDNFKIDSDLISKNGNTVYAQASGGGLDIKLADRLSLRAIQADYIYVNQIGHNVRLSTGLVFNF